MCVDVHIDSGISVLGAFCQARGYEVPAGATNPFFLGIWEDVSSLGPKKYQKIARMYDRTSLSTKCTLIKIDLFRPSDPNSDLYRPFVEALVTNTKISS